jgi:hypothetical protein
MFSMPGYGFRTSGSEGLKMAALIPIDPHPKGQSKPWTMRAEIRTS